MYFINNIEEFEYKIRTNKNYKQYIKNCIYFYGLEEASNYLHRKNTHISSKDFYNSLDSLFSLEFNSWLISIKNHIFSSKYLSKLFKKRKLSYFLQKTYIKHSPENLKASLHILNIIKSKYFKKDK